MMGGANAEKAFTQTHAKPSTIPRWSYFFVFSLSRITKATSSGVKLFVSFLIEKKEEKKVIFNRVSRVD